MRSKKSSGSSARAAKPQPSTAKDFRRSLASRLRSVAINVSLAAASVVVILLIAEAALRLYGPGGPRRYFVVRGGGADAIVETARYEPTPRLPIRMVPVTFPLKKPSGGLRIFCFGGSTVYGYPFGPKGTFPNLLQALLRAALPGRPVEVINAGFTGGDSARELALMKETVPFSPDIFIVYSGHNEFLRYDYPQEYDHVFGFNRSAAVPMGLRCEAFFNNNSLLWRWARGTAPIRNLFQASEKRRYGYSGGRSGKLPQDLLDAIYASYEANLEEMISLSKEKGVPIIFCTQVCNLRSVQPLFAPLPPELNTKQRESIRQARNRAAEQLASQRPDLALQTIEEARRIVPRDAYLAFLAGSALLKLGQIDRAKVELQSAVENDGLRHRAPARVNEIVRRVATRPGALLCDVQRTFETNSPNEIVGGEWILDHVHPNLEGLVLIAQELARTLEQAKLAPPGASAAATPEQLQQAVALTTEEWRKGICRLALSAAGRGNNGQAAGLFIQAAGRFDPGEPHAQAEQTYLRGLAELVRGQNAQARQTLLESQRLDPEYFNALNAQYAQLQVTRFLGERR